MAKVKTTWMRKADYEEIPKPHKIKPQMRKYTPSKHPMVKFEKRIENEDADVRVAMLAGFEAEHCGENFSGGREIARMRLPNGNVRRAFACDVCGYVHFKETAT